VVLTKEEFIAALQNEMRILLHLASKVDASMLDYRPTPQQRSMMELLQYLTIMGPIHLRATLAPAFDMEAWKAAWTTGEGTAITLTLEEVRDEMVKQAAVFAELLAPLSDADLRAQIEMFGSKASRGAMLVNLVLNHYAAYRMQLFLYLKGAGRTELNTMNLWVGRDA
jgi:hypothetical protein